MAISASDLFVSKYLHINDEDLILAVQYPDNYSVGQHTLEEYQNKENALYYKCKLSIENIFITN